jgi:hypothetical protein
MKIIHYILFVAFAIFAITLLGKIFLLFPVSRSAIAFGLFLLTVTSVVYLIVALIKSKERLEAGMIASGIPIYIGLSFSILLWPFGGVLIVTFSGILLMLSLGVLGYIVQKNRKVFLGICYVAFGFGGLFFCFKYMLWPGSQVIFMLFILAAIAAIVFFVAKKVPLELSTVTSLLLAGILIILFLRPTSDIYRIKYLDVLRPNTNFPESYHKYAWYLFQDGKIEEAKANLTIAIQQAQNPDNIFAHSEEVENDPDVVPRYQRALDAIDNNQWPSYEKSPFESR